MVGVVGVVEVAWPSVVGVLVVGVVEVLSVIAVQVKSIQDAITDKKVLFDFMGEEIPMNPTVGYFITMNPGKLILSYCQT